MNVPTRLTATTAALALTTLFLATADRTQADLFVATWNGSSDDWSVASNWSTDPVVPNNGTDTFDVIISSGEAFIEDGDFPTGVTINNISLSNGSVRGSSSLTLVGDPDDASAVSEWVATSQNSELRLEDGLTVGPDAKLEISGSNIHRLGIDDNGDQVDDFVALTIEGAADFQGGTISTRGEGAAIDVLNGGTFEWTSDGDFTGFSSPGVFTNAGTVNKSAGTGLASFSSVWTFENNGTFSVASGRVVLSSGTNGFSNTDTVEVVNSNSELQLGGGTNTGTITVGSDAQLTIDSSSSVALNNEGATASIANSGTLEIDGNINFSTNATYTGAGQVSFVDGSLGGDAPISIQNLDWSGGDLRNTGGVTIPGGSVGTLSGSDIKGFDDDALLVVEGTLNVTGTGPLTTNADPAMPATIDIASGGVLDVQTTSDFKKGAGSARGGTINNAGTLVKSTSTGLTQVESAWTINNTGTLDIDTGTFEIDSNFTHSGTSAVDVATDAVLQFDGDVTSENNFTGTGTIEFNAGYMPGASPAVVSFAGNVAFGADSELLLEIGGTGGGEYDALNIVGDLSFLGDLTLSLIELVPDAGEFEPTVGDSFTLLSFDGVLAAGDTFGSATLPPAPEMTAWTLDVLQNSVVLSLEELAVESADYNGDGTVNLADYTVWRDNLGAGDGTPGSLTVGDGDGNGDGMVDTTDYDLWKLQFGSVVDIPELVAVGATSVPEPGSLAIALLAMTGAMAARRSK